MLLGLDQWRKGLSFRLFWRVRLTFPELGVVAGDGESRFSESDRTGVGRRGGESGEQGVGEDNFEVTSRKADGLDGDRESDRRNWRNAEVGST